MKNSKIKKILAGVQTAVLVAGITVATSGCQEKKGPCGSCGSKMKSSSMVKDANSSCAKGSCSKGSCGGKGSCSK